MTRQGFTLIELIIGLSLLVASVSIIAPSLGWYQRTLKIDQVTQDLRTLTRTARNLAIKSGQPVELVILDDRIVVRSNISSAPLLPTSQRSTQASVVETCDLQGCSLKSVSGSPITHFFQDGSSSGNQLMVQFEGTNSLYEIDRWTGIAERISE